MAVVAVTFHLWDTPCMAENGCPWCGCELTFRAVDGTPICSGCNHVRRRAPLPADPDGEAEAMRKVHDGGPKVGG
jgi:uncharacterized Zn finger protein (UPF0148 family)